MDRRSHPKYIPTFVPALPPADTYLSGRDENWTAYSLLNTGMSAGSVYDLNGNINYTLPLEQYPPINGYHVQAHLMDRYQKRYTKAFI